MRKSHFCDRAQGPRQEDLKVEIRGYFFQSGEAQMAAGRTKLSCKEELAWFLRKPGCL